MLHYKSWMVEWLGLPARGFVVRIDPNLQIALAPVAAQANNNDGQEEPN